MGYTAGLELQNNRRHIRNQRHCVQPSDGRSGYHNAAAASPCHFLVNFYLRLALVKLSNSAMLTLLPADLFSE
jgi:hypothetical protein